MKFIERFFVVLLLLSASFTQAVPVITWVSDPVLPNEAVLVRGDGFGSAPVIEFARLDDNPAESADLQQWRRLPVLQAADDALKFIVPADAAPGAYVCRVVAGEGNSVPLTLNRPDIWWLQGDRGDSAIAGGWLRIFGKCLGTNPAAVQVQLVSAAGKSIPLAVADADGWSLRTTVPADLPPGRYTVRVYNGHGNAAAWSDPQPIAVAAPAPWPDAVYTVLAPYGDNAVSEMRRSLRKYGQPVDRSEGVVAALAKAKANGGGVVYFPAGRYYLSAPLELPPHTVLKGEGMGLVTLWWGQGKFNLDGGGDQGLAKEAEPQPPNHLIWGPSFAIEDMSIYLPLAHRTGIGGSEEVRLRRVRVRVDHLWAQDGNKRPEGFVARLGRLFEVTDCDFIAKGEGLKLGEYGVVARNRILAGKSPCPFGGGLGVIIEDNVFVSTYPTAYQNNPGMGENIYYARNRNEAQNVHQADFSYTFDRGDAAYHGQLAAVVGARLTLAADPVFPKWANADHPNWQRSVVCIVDGKGSSQWRHVASFSGRDWILDKPFLVAPDTASTVTIVPMCGRALMIDNQYEDANWVNAGYGTAIDVIYAGNRLVRCAELLNYGMASDTFICPNFNVQGFDNVLSEGLGSIVVSGSIRPAGAFGGQVTQNVIHRREKLAADNSGRIAIQSAALREVIVENCSVGHADSTIKVEGGPRGVLLRGCRSTAGELRLDGAVQMP